ncbi:MAG: alkaline phosphatase family protein [Pyrinomonadaceae bacterium]
MTTEPIVLLFFIDGLGIGTRGPHNPLDNLSEAAPLAIFQNEIAEACFNGIVAPTDPRLGVAGRPQSASGQTTILTGVNAPSILGHHKQGFPNRHLLKIIAEHSIFRRLREKQIESITFANAYTSQFFTQRPRWVSATTAAVEAANIPFRNVNDLRSDRALYQDFTNRVLIERGEDVLPRTPDEAASVLAQITNENRFTLYEFFITDKIGHTQDFEKARAVVPQLARFIRQLLAQLDLSRTTVILTSDHGNIEDLATRNHTLNDVPTIVWGANQEAVAARIKTLADVTPTILNLLTAHT